MTARRGTKGTYDLMRLVAPVVAVLWTTSLASCTGPAGPSGADGQDGTDGVDGADGTSCTVASNGDGTQTISCDDGTSVTVEDGSDGASCTVSDNGNGTSTITCTDGTEIQVSDGSSGVNCWDLNGNGIAESSEDINSDGIWDAIDCAGDSSGGIAGVVTDANTRAMIEGATVILSPLDSVVVTDAGGAFSFNGIPFGVYELTVSTPSLKLEGSAITSGSDVSIEVSELSVLAGRTFSYSVSIPRLDLDTLNLNDLHAGSQSTYTSNNCIACHSDRKAETTSEAGIDTYHNVGQHSSLSCTSCHTTAVGVDISNLGDWSNESAAALRKQVSVTTCTSCHTCYPTSFCAGSGCASPCP